MPIKTFGTNDQVAVKISFSKKIIDLVISYIKAPSAPSLSSWTLRHCHNLIFATINLRNIILILEMSTIKKVITDFFDTKVCRLLLLPYKSKMPRVVCYKKSCSKWRMDLLTTEAHFFTLNDGCG